MPIVFVTGLGCSGKSTYATSHFENVVHIDALKFGPNWKRVPTITVLSELRRLAQFETYGTNPDVTIAFEGLYHDPSDDVTRVFIRELMDSKRLSGVVCMNPPLTALDQATRIMTRSFNRLLGTCEQNESGNVERPANVARMMEKTFAYFGECCAHLADLSDRCLENNIPFEYCSCAPVQLNSLNT